MKFTAHLVQVLTALGVTLACSACLSACAPKRLPTPTASAPARRPVAQCPLEGCCQGHGEIAYLQRDLAVICTDGTPSTICDCHM